MTKDFQSKFYFGTTYFNHRKCLQIYVMNFSKRISHSCVNPSIACQHICISSQVLSTPAEILPLK